jgi:hypothetical protein
MDPVGFGAAELLKILFGFVLHLSFMIWLTPGV